MKKTISLIMILSILFVLSAYPVSATNRLMGDVNGDGLVSISDATYIQRHLAELEMIPDEYLPYAMVSDDDELTISDWNQVHGFTAKDVAKDLEGLQTMRNLARNMSFMIKTIADGKEKYGYPESEHNYFTSFPDGL